MLERTYHAFHLLRCMAGGIAIKLSVLDFSRSGNTVRVTIGIVERGPSLPDMNERNERQMNVPSKESKEWLWNRDRGWKLRLSRWQYTCRI